MKNVSIQASHYHVPEKRLTLDDLSQRFDPKKMLAVAESSGIFERRVAESDVCGSDLAFQAAQELVEAYNIDTDSINAVLFCTQSPDYLLPTTACLLQDRLGIHKNCVAFDINQGCSQYVYGLYVATSIIRSEMAENVLLLTGDTPVKSLHPDDQSTVPLFGDAGTASLISATDEPGGISFFEMGSDGSHPEYLIIPAGGSRQPCSPKAFEPVIGKDGNPKTPMNLHLDGKSIFIFAIKIVPQMISNLLEKANLKLDDIDLFIFHQANRLMIETIMKKVKIPFEKTHYCLKYVGNSGGSTVAMAYTEAWRAGKLKPGKKVMFLAFGVGLSWGGALYEVPENTLGPVLNEPLFTE